MFRAALLLALAVVVGGAPRVIELGTARAGRGDIMQLWEVEEGENNGWVDVE